VERSFDGIDFIQIATVPAAGYSLSSKEYSFTDYDVNMNRAIFKIYYRLRMVSLDQLYKFSEVRSINPDNTTISFSNNQVTIGLYDDEEALFQLVDMMGRVVVDKQIYQGINVIQLDKIPAGICSARITSKNQKKVLI